MHDVAATRLALDVVDSWNGAPPTHALRGGRGGEQAGDDARDATTQDELESGAPAESEAAE